MPLYEDESRIDALTVVAMCVFINIHYNYLHNQLIFDKFCKHSHRVHVWFTTKVPESKVNITSL